MADSEDQFGSSPEEILEDQPLSKEAQGDVRTLAKGGGLQIAGQLSQRGFSFVFVAVAVRFLGTAGFGIYRKATQILTDLSQLGLGGFNLASMRFIARARARGDHGAVRGAMRVALWGTAIGSAIVFTGIELFAHQIAQVFADKDVAFVTFLLRVGAAYVPLFATVQVLRYCTQAYKTMVPSVMVGNIIQPAARFVIGVGVLIAGFGITGALVSLEIAAGIAAIAGAFYLSRMLTPDERSAPIKRETGPMVRFSLLQMAASLLGIQTLGLGILILSAFSTNRQVGLFAIALALQGPGNVFLGGIINIWAPVVTDLYERNEIARLQSLYQTVNRWVATFSFPIFVALIVTPELFVHVFAGSAGKGAAEVVTLLALGNAFYVGTGPTGYMLSMTGRPGVNAINSAISVVAYIGLGFLVTKNHGAVGMAIVDSAVTAVINLARVAEAWIIIGVQPYGRRFLKPVAGSAAVGVVLAIGRFAFGTTVPIQVASLAVGLAVYVLVLRALGLDQEERHVLDRIKRRALRRGKS
ncbi:MAG: oligosaccharide flippase family protein [Actinomycetota bacterium]|nr:oligosaccharide flippase family protein [Actinomycetota bacterium]